MKKIFALTMSLFAFTACSNIDISTFNNEKIGKNQIELNTVQLMNILKNRKIDSSVMYGIKKQKVQSTGIINSLTGLDVEKEFENTRPYAVVFNNLKVALPQSGISEADIYYEVLAEAGITRIIGVSHNYTVDKIGPIRSTRDYFLDFCLDNDAIFVHHGGSPQGYASIQNNKINNLDGMALEGISFFRDYERASKRGLEHSSYTSAENIKSSVNNYGYDILHNKEFIPGLEFNQDDVILDGTSAIEVKIPFSDYQTGRFVYNEDEKMYYRFQGEDKHIDEYYDIQLNVKNVMVQFADMKVVDDIGRRQVDLVGQGWGYYFTNGKYILTKWKKDGHFAPTKWFNEKDEPLLINKGKTWICVIKTDSNVEIIVDK